MCYDSLYLANHTDSLYLANHTVYFSALWQNTVCVDMKIAIFMAPEASGSSNHKVKILHITFLKKMLFYLWILQKAKNAYILKKERLGISHFVWLYCTGLTVLCIDELLHGTRVMDNVLAYCLNFADIFCLHWVMQRTCFLNAGVPLSKNLHCNLLWREISFRERRNGFKKFHREKH